MSQSRAFNPAFFSLFIWLVLLLAHSWHGPDIWYHLTWGRELAEFGNWIPRTRVLLPQPIAANGYWLFQILIYTAFKTGGIYLVSLIFAALWLCISMLWLEMGGLWNKPFGPWLFVAFVVCMQLRFEQRPEVFSYFFMTLMSYWAWRGRFWPLIAAQVLWTNMHGYFIFGPLLACAIDFSERGSWRRVAGLGSSLLLATVATPFGYKNWLNVWSYARLGEAMADLNQELFPPQVWPLTWISAVFWLAWLATVAAAVWSLSRRRQVSLAILALIGAFLSARMTRNMPLVFLFSPLLWRTVQWNWSGVWSRLGALAVGGVGAALSLSVVLGFYHGWVGALSRFGVKLEAASYPLGVAEFLRDRNFDGKLFCDSYDGGYLEFHLPDARVAGDSYFSDSRQTRRFFSAIKQPQALRQLDAEIGFDALVINIENLDVMNGLLDSPDWVAGFADSHRAVFFKRARHSEFDGDLTKFRYYSGEGLDHWTYEFGIVSWMALAFQRDLPGLMNKIVHDMAEAPVIPARPFNMAVKFATNRRDADLIRFLASLKDKVKS